MNKQIKGEGGMVLDVHAQTHLVLNRNDLLVLGLGQPVLLQRDILVPEKKGE